MIEFFNSLFGAKKESGFLPPTRPFEIVELDRYVGVIRDLRARSEDLSPAVQSMMATLPNGSSFTDPDVPIAGLCVECLGIGGLGVTVTHLRPDMMLDYPLHAAEYHEGGQVVLMNHTQPDTEAVSRLVEALGDVGLDVVNMTGINVMDTPRSTFKNNGQGVEVSVEGNDLMTGQKQVISYCFK